MAYAAVRSKFKTVVVDSLLIFLLLGGVWGLCVCSMFYCAIFYARSSFAIILIGKRSWLLYFACLPVVL